MLQIAWGRATTRPSSRTGRPERRVDGIEIDAPLATAATSNLKAWPTAPCRGGRRQRAARGSWDLIVAFAGATQRMLVVDGLADGGRLLLPLTRGISPLAALMLRLERRGNSLPHARPVGSASIPAPAHAAPRARRAGLPPCDPAGQQAIRSLRRDPHEKDDSCWLHRAVVPVQARAALMAKPLKRFVCQRAAQVTSKWGGRCESCGEGTHRRGSSPRAGPGRRRHGARRQGRNARVRRSARIDAAADRYRSGIAIRPRLRGGRWWARPC